MYPRKEAIRASTLMRHGAMNMLKFDKLRTVYSLLSIFSLSPTNIL